MCVSFKPVPKDRHIDSCHFFFFLSTMGMRRPRTESWGLQLRAWAPDDLWRVRRDYAALRDQHNNDPRDTSSSSSEAANLAANNPLMAAQDSPWAVYFRNQEARARREKGCAAFLLFNSHVRLHTRRHALAVLSSRTHS